MKRDAFRPEESQWLRNMVELSLLFLIAVIMLRGFILEGYLISTGSMAPGLLGLHKHVECPSCGFPFAFGVTFDESVDGEATDDDGSHLRTHARCPNCGQASISVESVPISHGDQLLVHKGVFDLRRPRRWETIVFRNPASPGEAYVKRAVGLPGETLQIQNGDLFIEGQIARKDFETSRSLRIEVFDIACLAGADDWRMPWQMKGNWRLDDGQLVCAAETEETEETAGVAGTADSGDRQTDEQTVSWLHWRSFRWSGGAHVTEVPLTGGQAEADWQTCLREMQNRPVTWVSRIEFDRERQVLSMRGVMPYQMQQDLVTWADSEPFRNAVFRLAALSHISPLTDLYAYNSSVASPEFPVHDLMLDVELSWRKAPEWVSVTLPVRHEVFRLELQPSSKTAELISETTGDTVRVAALPEIRDDAGGESRMQLEVSNFDHRIIVAVDGIVLFPELDLPVALAELTDSDPAPIFQITPEKARQSAEAVTQQSRLALGISGGAVRLEALKLFRDVYYTPGRRRHGVQTPVQIPSNCYFVLGDNSPVSADSRNWEDPCVPHKLLVGKPFVVHLPSRPGKLTLGGYELPIRIPDFERIRYIH
ncbi:MAG: S26 family signal peptidase [Fuerstiella sp.]